MVSLGVPSFEELEADLGFLRNGSSLQESTLFSDGALDKAKKGLWEVRQQNVQLSQGAQLFKKMCVPSFEELEADLGFLRNGSSLQESTLFSDGALDRAKKDLLEGRRQNVQLFQEAQQFKKMCVPSFEELEADLALLQNGSSSQESTLFSDDARDRAKKDLLEAGALQSNIMKRKSIEAESGVNLFKNKDTSQNVITGSNKSASKVYAPKATGENSKTCRENSGGDQDIIPANYNKRGFLAPSRRLKNKNIGMYDFEAQERELLRLQVRPKSNKSKKRKY